MAAARAFRACSCFFSDNVFVRRCGLHVRYRHREQLRGDYGTVTAEGCGGGAARGPLPARCSPPCGLQALRERGCGSPEVFEAVVREIEEEVQRRKQLIHQSAERKAIIASCYKRKHPEVYILQDSFLAPEFLEIVSYCTSPDAHLDGLLRYTESFSDKRIYRLPVFTEEFCRAFVEELENFEQSDMPKGRPNSMNNYGVLLNEIGMDENFVTPLREKYLRPITALLYPDLGGACLDSHKAFVVKYALHEDLDLSSHYDNAEVTLNVSLGKDFTEGNLYFGDFRQWLYRNLFCCKQDLSVQANCSQFKERRELL
ncbi:2-oxoglutarate and iron-dependent oxygenase domain-containing protein 2 isoform X4 [Anser cygnoides]|uniref:2-oxoglutarate and iron-dependent oxygenase domain-containing protein 2 isoform X4 n=1 Tax=Anser cygnoides TaxID=8845 RepID=UPI0034D1B088